VKYKLRSEMAIATQTVNMAAIANVGVVGLCSSYICTTRSIGAETTPRVVGLGSLVCGAVFVRQD
jgi:hypothetical protein